MISIIIRTKNEERWITSCLQGVFNQDAKDIEVIVVDNNSTDKTVEKAQLFNVKVIYIDNFLPGKAINKGISASKGDYIVCLSAHCVPVNNSWLKNLLKNFDDEKVGGVYGRQEPMTHSSDFDKRDLLITFGLDRRVQIKDSFFHNANSMIRREVWERFPFDEQVPNLEDRVWAKQLLENGYKIIYEPEASVYHYHGIHQERDQERCYNVVRVLESLASDEKKSSLNADKLNIVALIPIKGEVVFLGNRPLIEYTIERALQSRYIKNTIVLTDNEKLAKISKKAGADVPFIRDESYSADHVDLETVLNYSLNILEDQKILPDVLTILEATFPFRSTSLIDDLIEQLLSQGLDSVIPGIPEYGSHWTQRDGALERVDEGDIPRVLKKPIYRGLRGLGCYVREKKIYGDRVGIMEIFDPHSEIEVRDENGVKLAEKLLEDFWSKKDS
jgi:glycosyltransferase involved in cell wall biosynthesis